MPYHIRKKGKEFCIYNKETGEKKGWSDSYRKAVAYMRKLYQVENKPK